MRQHTLEVFDHASATRAFLRDVLGLPSVDVGDEWLIFGLPPAEVAVHPSEENDVHEFYLMCDDAEGFVADMEKRGVACAPAQNLGWGILTHVTLPGGGKLGVYQPLHARPKAKSPARKTKKTAAKAGKKSSKKKARKR